MNRRIRIGAAGLVLAAALAAGAHASTMENYTVAGWGAGAYSDDRSGQFDHCAASQQHKSGTWLIFSISRNFKWEMDFSNPAWHLQTGTSYDIAYSIDGSVPTYARALAINERQVAIGLADSTALFERFQRGLQMNVQGAGQSFFFNLTGTSQMLSSLLDCTRRHQQAGVQTGVASNPFVAPQPQSPPPAAPAATGNRRAEAAALVANLLSQSGLSGFYIFPPAQIPEALKTSDSAWRMGDVVGTVTIVDSPQAKTGKELAPAIIGGDAKACAGTFGSGSIPDDNGGPVTRIFTACQAAEGTVSLFYMLVPRPGGGIYVLATMARPDAAPAREADAQLRSAVKKVLLN